MPYLRLYDLFISHAWTYNAEYYSLVNKLDEHPNFKWRNYSVPEHDPLAARSTRSLAEALDRQVRPVHCVLIISGMYVSHRDWIQQEIDMACNYGKPIVGILPWGSQRVPSAVARAAKEIVGWRIDSIVSAIRTHAL
jgi:hypothetical protein